MRIQTTVLLLLLTVMTATATAAPPTPYYKAGLKSFAKGNYLKAAEEFTAALEVHPDVKTTLYLGNAYLKLGQLGKAKEALERALQIDPATPQREGIVKLVKNIASRNVGIVSITSTPAGATVYLNEKSENARGKTPFELSLPPGTHRLVFELQGHETRAAEVTIKFAETTALELALNPVSCELALNSTTPGARATIDGAEPAKPRVTLGEHRVVFSAGGFKPQEFTVRCEGAQPLALDATLAAIPGAATSVATAASKAAPPEVAEPPPTICPPPPPPPPPPPLRLPTWRLATGILGVSAGALTIGLGAPAIALDGICADQQLVAGVACSNQYQSLPAGVALVSVGSALTIAGTVLLALPPKNPSGRK